MAKKIDIVEAQKRLDDLFENSVYEIITWVNTTHPCKLKCKHCGNEIIVPKGSYVYKRTDNYYTNYLDKCNICNSMNITEIDEAINLYRELASNVKQAVKNLHKLPSHLNSVKEMWEILGCNNITKWETNLFPYQELSINVTKVGKRLEIDFIKSNDLDLKNIETQQDYYYNLSYVQFLGRKIHDLLELRNRIENKGEQND